MPRMREVVDHTCHEDGQTSHRIGKPRLHEIVLAQEQVATATSAVLRVVVRVLAVVRLDGREEALYYTGVECASPQSRECLRSKHGPDRRQGMTFCYSMQLDDVVLPAIDVELDIHRIRFDRRK